MSARDLILGRLLFATYDHHGLPIDLYGTLDEDGYQVRHACAPNTLISLTVSGELLDVMSAHCDDALPSAEELREAHAGESKLEMHLLDRVISNLPRWEPSF